jgi:hypothetical protein
MTDLSPEARSIIDAGRDADGAGDIERARVRRELMAKIAAGAVTLAASEAAAATTPGSSLTLAKILVPLAIVAGGVGGTLAWRAQHKAPVAPAAVVATAVAPAPAPVAPPPVIAPTIVPTVAPAPEPVRHTPPRRAHVAARAEANTDHLAEETALLASANAQLRAGDARRALALLDNYDHRYPGGMLREEVVATRVIARCQIGLSPDAAAKRGADGFLRRHPTSPLAPRVRSSCGR